MTTVTLVEKDGLTKVALNGGQPHACASWIGEAIKGRLAGVTLIGEGWGLVLRLDGAWKDEPASLRYVARLLMERAAALERNGHDHTTD